MSNENLTYSAKVTARFIELADKGEICRDDLIHLLLYLDKKLNIKTITAYADSENITYNGVLDRIESKKVTPVKIGKKKFIV